MQDFISNLKGVFKSNYPLKNLNWFKIGGDAEHFFSPQDIDDLIFFLKNKPQNLPITILGAGSNVLISDSGVAGVVIKLNNFDNCSFLEDGKIFAESGALNISVSNLALRGNPPQGGFEFLSGIPGNIGGAISMNAGSFGREFCDICVSVKALNLNGDILNLAKEDLGFSYRKNSLKEPLIFISSIMQGYEDNLENIKQKLEDIKIKRNDTQPKKVLTGGSTFANPKENNPHGYKAWQLIDKVGLRGYKIGDAGFSEKHCNFIINYGNAVAEDIEKLIAEAQNRVKAEFGIELHQEIKFIK
ncbi:MAG: UDP-N-acetylmuramate dehydrogenase [Alphaproteobacteria bacterium]|jgi:UDP-N-acetylmuramate dehydrogenase|nr:UDP-N-acetylmuramate dehydrogenase [Alphaproteobacteria bacterium]